MGFTMAEKNKIREEYAKRYRKAKKPEKTRILDEYLKLLGGKGNRKYAIYTLNREGKKQLRLIDGKSVNVIISSTIRKKRVYEKYYNEEVAEVLIKLWKFFRYICGERMVPLLRSNSKNERIMINCLYGEGKIRDISRLPECSSGGAA